MEWQEQAAMSTPRRRHACGTLISGDKKVVIAAGGDTSQHAMTKTVEILVVEDDDRVFAQEWEFGPDMPLPVSNAASSTTPNQRTLFVIGGKTSQDYSQGSSAIFKIHCQQDLQCMWSKVEQELKMPSAKGLALMLPPIPMANRGYGGKIQGCATSQSGIFLLTTGWNGLQETRDTLAYVTDLKDAVDSNSSTQQQHIQVRCWPLSSALASPIAVADSTGALLRTPEVNKLQKSSSYYTAVFCGGLTASGGGSKNCYKLGGSSLQPLVSMTRVRIDAISTVIGDGGTLWVTGGYDTSGTDLITTEWIRMASAADAIIGEGVDLPRPTSFHCLEMIDQDMAILYGGSEYIDSAETLHDVWTLTGLSGNVPAFSTSNEGLPWTSRPPMMLTRREHICGVIKQDTSSGNMGKIVVAAGGMTSYPGIVTDHVEFLSVDGNNVFEEEWVEGPKLPHAICRAGSATTQDQTMLFVSGGMIEEDPWVASIFILTLKCVNNICEWAEADIELENPLTHTVAMILPPGGQFADLDLENSCKKIYK